MSPFIAEIVGTSILIILGDGVVANVILSKTKGFNGGLISITFGWSMAVFVGVYVSATASGAHLNPAVTIALAYAGKFDWALVPQYLVAQLIGAMIGPFLVWLAYKQHFDETTDPAEPRRCADPSRPVPAFRPAATEPSNPGLKV